VLRYRTPTDAVVHAEYVAESAAPAGAGPVRRRNHTRGLNVHLTVNAADQAVAYRALRKGLLDYERRQHYRGPEDLHRPARRPTRQRWTPASPRPWPTTPTTTS
jgi:penicillin-binding protein 1A